MKKFACVRLKELRVENNFSLDQLAQLTGFSLNKLNKFEQGLDFPNLYEMTILSFFLNARIDYVAGTSTIRHIPANLPFGEYDNYIREHEKHSIKNKF